MSPYLPKEYLNFFLKFFILHKKFSLVPMWAGGVNGFGTSFSTGVVISVTECDGWGGRGSKKWWKMRTSFMDGPIERDAFSLYTPRRDDKSRKYIMTLIIIYLIFYLQHIFLLLLSLFIVWLKSVEKELAS